MSRGDVDLNRDESAGQPAGSPASAPAEGVDYRRVADYQRAEIRSLEARAHELERRLRRRTVALFGALALTGVGAIGAAYLVVTPRLELPPAAAPRVAATSGPGTAPAGAVAPEPRGQAPTTRAWPAPAAERPAPPAAAREAGPPPYPEADSPPRAEPSRADEAHVPTSPGVPVRRATPEELVAKEPGAGVEGEEASIGSDREPRPLDEPRAADVATAGVASPAVPPEPQTKRDGQRADADGGDGTVALQVVPAGTGERIEPSVATSSGKAGGGRTGTSPAGSPSGPGPEGRDGGRDGPAAGQRDTDATAPAGPGGIDAGSAPVEPIEAREAGEVRGSEPSQVPPASAAAAPPVVGEEASPAPPPPVAKPPPEPAGSAQIRVFIHYRAGSTADAALAQDLAERLRREGFAVAGLRPVPSQISTGSVRYFFARDLAEARRLLATCNVYLAQAARPAVRGPVAFTRFEPKPAPDTVEVWLPSGS